MTRLTASKFDRAAIMILGDSISAGYGIQREQGWVQLLARTLTESELPWDTVNASISGETSSGALARLPDLLNTHSPKLLVIELGGNDGLRGYPTEIMQKNLAQIVELARAAGAEPVIMAMRIPPNYGPRYTRAFETVYRDISTKFDLLYIPFFLEELAVEPGMMQSDGIHPTAAAQPRMRDIVLNYLKPILAAQ
ncbi:MAG: arylesterase [Pseudomonadales bacterium]|nr:arylesterase [Pseudomonadales bacterium]